MKLKTYCAVAAIAALSATSASAALVVHYKLDDDGAGGVSTANSGSSAHTWNGSANASLTTGKFGGAGAFVNTAPASDWWSNSNTGADMGSFTLSFHLSTTTAANWQDYLSIGTGAGQMLKFEQNGAHGGLSLYSTGTPGGTAVSFDGSAADSVTGGDWHHVALVSNGSTIELYLDGASIFSQAYAGTGDIDALQLAAEFGAGRRQNTNIDDVALYDEALDSSQIGWLSNNEATATVVPEPSSTALLGLGGLALILRRRK